jgi:hypothetical protein
METQQVQQITAILAEKKNEWAKERFFCTSWKDQHVFALQKGMGQGPLVK